MKKPLRIVVADDEKDMLDYYRIMLFELGHEVVAEGKTGKELVDACAQARPDLVITDIKMPDMDGLEAARRLAAENPIPVILVSAYHDAQLISEAAADHVFAYLVKPVKKANLEPAIAIALSRFAQFQALQQEATSLRQALEDRKVIERAKGALMQRANLSEDEAYRRINKVARSKNQKLIEVARSVLTAESLYENNGGDEP